MGNQMTNIQGEKSHTKLLQEAIFEYVGKNFERGEGATRGSWTFTTAAVQMYSSNATVFQLDL